MSKPILIVQNLSKSFGGIKVLDSVDFVVNTDEIVGIMGPNGSGKTVLFDIISGHVKPDSGNITYGEKKVNLLKLRESERFRHGITRTYQHLNLFSSLTVYENIAVGLRKKPALFYLKSLLRSENLIKKTINEEKRIAATLKIFDKNLKDSYDFNCLSLSYANRRRLEFARALVSHPKLIFLDEPTAGMNPKETLELQSIISKLRKQGLSFVIIEHKLFFLEDLVNRIIVLNEGKKIAEDSVESIRINKDVLQVYFGQNYAS